MWIELDFIANLSSIIRRRVKCWIIQCNTNLKMSTMILKIVKFISSFSFSNNNFRSTIPRRITVIKWILGYCIRSKEDWHMGAWMHFVHHDVGIHALRWLEYQENGEGSTESRNKYIYEIQLENLSFTQRIDGVSIFLPFLAFFLYTVNNENSLGEYLKFVWFC